MLALRPRHDDGPKGKIMRDSALVAAPSLPNPGPFLLYHQSLRVGCQQREEQGEPPNPNPQPFRHPSVAPCPCCCFRLRFQDAPSPVLLVGTKTTLSFRNGAPVSETQVQRWKIQGATFNSPAMNNQSGAPWAVPSFFHLPIALTFVSLK